MSACLVTDGSHLTTSRINRLLRPLRNKCLSLSKFLTAAQQGASRGTSLSHGQNWSPESPPPLALLHQPPSATRGRLCLDKGFAQDLELARLIYAVCDAFRNLLQVTHGAVPGEPIPTLAAVCCFVVGENIPLSSDATHEGQEEAVGEDELMKVVDDIYDAIPTYYRRHSIASHGLSLVLALCPRHHTLISTLLDICLSFGLVHESRRLLSTILEDALSTTCPPIMHPAHVSYLADLLVRWISGNNNLVSSSTPPLFSVSTFSRAVLGVLAQSDAFLWSSKAISRFARSFEATDIDSFVTLLDVLVETIHNFQPMYRSGKGKEKEKENPDVVVLRDCLRDWMNRLTVVIRDSSAGLADRSCCPSIDCIVMLLDRCRSSGLHILRLGASSQPFQNELPDAITTLAAHLHVSYSLPDYHSRLLHLLREVSPIPTTFSQLVEHMHQNSTQDFMTSLQQFSSALQIHNLLQLDASLWACALRVFENVPKGTSKEIERTKLLLIDAVDEAERRLFGAGPSDSSPAVRIPGQAKRSRGAHYRRPSGEWKWEEMVGGWIQKTPVHAQKKRKTAHVSLRESPSFIQCLLRRGAQRYITKGAIVLPKLKSAKSTASWASDFPCSPSLQGSEDYAESNDDSVWGEEDEENVIPSSPIAERRSTLKPRHSDFSSILADAQKNRVNLHKLKPHSTSVMKRRASSGALSSSKQSRPLARKWFYAPAVCPPEAALTSDDSMDLFACATSPRT